MRAQNDLARIVRINEQIKGVVRLARAINILALNAIIVSRRAGQVARSFGVISNELRIFSRELTQTMASLRQISYATVGRVSRYERYRRIHELMNLTNLNVKTDLMSKQLTISNKRIKELRQDVFNGYDELTVFLDEAAQSGRFGTVISRSLKIEAAYGGTFSQSLMLVAQQFDSYIESIPGIVGEISELLKHA